MARCASFPGNRWPALAARLRILEQNFLFAHLNVNLIVTAPRVLAKRMSRSLRWGCRINRIIMCFIQFHSKLCLNHEGFVGKWCNRSAFPPTNKLPSSAPRCSPSPSRSRSQMSATLTQLQLPATEYPSTRG